jgi:integrase
MTLNYHRCHSTDCEGKHPAKTFTSETEEHVKGWKRCHCPIVASGTLNRVAKRKATKQTEWAAAAEVMVPYIVAKSWVLPEDEPPTPPAPKAPVPPPQTPAPASDKVTVKAATEEYIKEHQKAESAPTTLDGHRQRMASICKFAEETGWLYLTDWDAKIANQYLNQFRVAPITARKYRKMVKAFFAWCIAKEWIATNPGKAVAVINNRATSLLKVGKERQPLVDAELERMYQGCLRYDALFPVRKWRGEDLADFIALSVHTGLRISDVATFNINRLKGADEVRIRTLKRGKMVYTVVPPWLAERIRIRAEKFGPLIFGAHRSTKLDVITHCWRMRLNELWKQCGSWEIKPTPHRFRHTFCRILLESGRSYADVADLTGDTEAVIREHYASWVPGRQERVSKLLRESFADVPVPAYARSNKPARVIEMVKVKRG